MPKKKKEKNIVEETLVNTIEKFDDAVEDVVKEIVNETKDIAKKTMKKVEKKISEAAKELAEANRVNTIVVEKNKDDEKVEIDKLRKKLKEKAKALESKIKEEDSAGIKEKVTGEKEEKKEMLVPIEDYLKSSIHLGTRVITPDMRKYVYRRRADGLAVFNTSLLDDKIREGIEFISKYDPDKFIIVCKREAGWKPAKLMAETLGVKVFTKKYPAGILTNINLENFFETDMVFICDPWIDKNALNDANKVGSKVMSICDTNNFTAGIDFVLPGNNKSWKSIGMIFYLLTKGYIEKRKMNIRIPSIQEFVEGWDTLQPPV